MHVLMLDALNDIMVEQSGTRNACGTIYVQLAFAFY
jgi:hypothetical protein